MLCLRGKNLINILLTFEIVRKSTVIKILSQSYEAISLLIYNKKYTSGMT